MTKIDNKKEQFDIEEVIGWLGDESLDEFQYSFNSANEFVQLDCATIAENGQFTKINGDIDPFLELRQGAALQNLFSQNLSILRYKDGLIISRQSKAIDAMKTRKLIHVGKYIIRAAIDSLQLLDKITDAEFSLVVDLISGLSTKESATKSGASYHTRRNQVKSILEKTGVKSQTELVRNVTAMIYAQIQTIEQEPENSQNEASDFSDYLNGVFGLDYRFHNIKNFDGSNLRVIDIGPVSGRPVIYCHGLITIVGFFDLDWMYDNNIRILIPLRAGCFQKLDDILSSEEYLQKSILEIQRLVAIWGLEKPTILASTSGCASAVGYAKIASSNIETLIIVSGVYVKGSNNRFLNKFRKIFLNVNMKNQYIREKVINFYLYKMRDSKITIKLYDFIYKGSVSDRKFIRNALSNANVFQYMHNQTTNSWQSVIMEVCLEHSHVWQDLNKISCSTVFLHGTENPTTSLDAIRSVQQKIANSRLLIAENKGQIVGVDFTLDAVLKSVNGKAS